MPKALMYKFRVEGFDDDCYYSADDLYYPVCFLPNPSPDYVYGLYSPTEIPFEDVLTGNMAPQCKLYCLIGEPSNFYWIDGAWAMKKDTITYDQPWDCMIRMPEEEFQILTTQIECVDAKELTEDELQNEKV